MNMEEDLYTSKSYQPAGLKHAEQIIIRTGKNYHAVIIEKTFFIYKRLDLIDTDIILDIGSGMGDVSKNFSRIVKHVYCCDINQGLLNIAEAKCSERHNMSFHIVNRPYKPLAFLTNNSITKAFANHVFIHCHTNTMVNYLKEVHRVLKKDGLFFSQYCIKADITPTLFPINEEEIIETIKQLNFNIILQEKYNSIDHEDFTGINLLLSK